jgi:hypothetical protein
MKKFVLALALLMGVMSSCQTVEAQVSINVSINIGRQPAWGPVGYDYVDYYYFPDINCYFNVNLGLFYYLDRGMWISAQFLPYAYSGYNLYNMYKAVLVGVVDPWRYNYMDMRKYARYRGYGNQMVIRDSRDMRYRESRNNTTAWYSGNRNTNSANRNGVYQSNNRNYSGNNNYGNTRTVDRAYNNGSRNNQAVNNRNYNNNNVIQNGNRSQQNQIDNGRIQRNFDNQPVSRRNNDERTAMRSGSSSRSDSYAGSYERRQGNSKSESSNRERRNSRGR